jgi:HD-like signal output (HDOD) protein
VRLGQNEVRNMMLAISLQTRIFKSRLYGRLAKMYWERSVGVAFAGRVLASALRADKDEAFLCGLMHNLGRMIALTIVEEAQRHVGEEFRPLRRTVLGIVDQYHRDIGELTVDKWSLPPAVAEVIRYYERLEDQISTNRTPAVVALGEVCCRLGGVGAEQAEEVDIAEHLAAKKLQVDGETFQGLHARFMQIFENAKAEFL